MEEVNIIGGGIGGCTIALEIAKTRRVNLYEQTCLLSNNHYCHAHFGLLYPELSNEEVIQMTKETTCFIKSVSESRGILYRPTIIAYHIDSKYSVSQLIEKCKIVESFLKDSFYQVYSYDEFYDLKDKPNHDYYDSYVYNTFRLFNTNKLISTIKFPFVCVKEFGIDSQEIRRYLLNKIESNKNINVLFKSFEDKSFEDKKNTYIFATGANTSGEAYETKANFEVRIQGLVDYLAEVAIVGERGSENGMLQITPIRRNLIIVHKMSLKGSLRDFDKNYVLDVLKEYLPIKVVSINASVGQQVIHTNIEDRHSNITNPKKNIYKIKLLKASSSVDIAKKMAKMLTC